MVSAETTPDPNQYLLNEIPGLMRVSRALVDIPINRYSTDTFELMRQAVAQWRRELRQRSPGTEGIFTADADIYFINASLTEGLVKMFSVRSNSTRRPSYMKAV